MPDAHPTWDLPRTTVERPTPAADPNPTHPAAAGRFRLIRELARGGMGVVYRADDPAIGREVAVKLLHDRLRRDPAAARRFVAEARVTGQLQHPGIPPVHEVGTLPDGSPYLAMKLVDGHTLAGLIADRPGPAHNLPRLVTVVEQVCQAVAFAHSRGIVHRDLKPANVMVGAFGEVQVMDWGLAKVRGEDVTHPAEGAAGADPNVTTDLGEGAEATGRTRAGAVVGTPAYMAPEQARGEPVDARADVFALGAILAEVLTGRRPFGGGSAAAVLRRAAAAGLNECLARLDACGADAELVTLARRCLSADPAGRPSDAGEVAGLMAAYQAGVEDRLRKAEAERAAAAARAVEQRKKQRVQRALAAAVLVIAAGGGAFGWWLDHQATEQQTADLRRQIEAERRAVGERERLARNAAAAAELLGRCEDALRADDDQKAGLALAAAANRVPEGGTEHLTDRFARCRADVAMLRALRAVNDYRWSPVGIYLPTPDQRAARWEAAFREFGIRPGTTPPAEVARRVADSPIKTQLLGALDLWLAAAPSQGLTDALAAADPHEYRDAVRAAVRAGDWGRVGNLVERPAASEQPARFLAAVGSLDEIPADRRRAVLEKAVLTGSGTFNVFMALGRTYPIQQPGSAAERARWCQAAVTADPRSVVAWVDLGHALSDMGDRGGAVAAYREAIRHDPKAARPHRNLGLALEARGDVDGAIAAWREAIRHEPTFTTPYIDLGSILERRKGDFDGAIAAYRGALRHEPGNARVLTALGAALEKKDDLDGAEAAFREALKHDPKNAHARNNLGVVRRRKGDLDGAAKATGR